MNQADPTPTSHITLRRIGFSAALGVVTFFGSNLLQSQLSLTQGEQLILSILVGGVTLLSTFLADFSQRQSDFGQHLEQRQTEFGDLLEQRQAEFGRHLELLEQNSLRQLVDASALQTDLLTRFIRRCSKIDENSVQLVRDLAHYEVDRVSALIRSLSEGEQVFYDGEDREWLLGLARNAQSSIVATSLVSVDAGGKSFEGGLWLNDLGARYLDIQRAARRRGVKIQRIFVFDAPDFERDPSFVRVRKLQREAGIEIRGLDETQVTEHLKNRISDFIVFDGVLGYETSRLTTNVQSAILTTRLVLTKERVADHLERFEELWQHAKPLPYDEPQPSGRVGAPAAGKDVADPVESIGGQLEPLPGGQPSE